MTVDFSRFPLPRSPIGLHAPSTVGAQTFPAAFGSLEEWMRFLVQEMGAGCYTWIGEPGFSVTRPIGAAAKAGLMVTVRVQPDGGEGHPRMTVDPASVRRGVDAGMAWLQLGNEPDSKGEWTRGDGGVQRGWMFVEALGHQLMDMASKAIAGGAHVLIPPMNAGYPSYDRDGNITDDGSDRVSHLNFFRWAQATGNLNQLKRWAEDGWLGVAVHNRPSNHFPPEYPNDTTCLLDPDYFQNKLGITDPVLRLQNDGTSFDSYRNIDDLNMVYLGRSVPLIGTEAGYTIEVAEDNRYRKIRDDYEIISREAGQYLGHAAANIELFARFAPDHPQRWRPALVGICMYHGLYAGDSFVEAWWQNGLLGRDLAIVTELPKWWRANASRFENWPARWLGAAAPPPAPPPVIDPPPDPDPLPDPDPDPPPPDFAVQRKLGFHVITWNKPLLDLILETGPSLVKLMNNPDPKPVEDILAKHPNTVIILRKFYDLGPQDDFLRDGIGGGRRCATEVMDHFSDVLAVCRKYGAMVLVEGLNEPPLNPYDSAPKRLAEFTKGFAETVWLNGFRPATLSLSVGQPEGDTATRAYIWRELEPALEATWDYDGVVAFHPYGKPPRMSNPDNPYYFNRPIYDRDHFFPHYRELPFVYTEGGVDGGTLEPPSSKAEAGWKFYYRDAEGKVSPEAFASDLRWAIAEMAKDPRILGMTPFTHGPTGDWDSFGMDGFDEINAVYREQAVVVPPVVPPAPEPPPVPEPEPTNGTRAALDDLWALASAMGQNGDTANEMFIKNRVVRLKVVLEALNALA